MTSLTKTVFRVTVGALDGSYGADRGRKLVAGLAVGDLIEMRPQGTRRTERLALLDAYRYAMRCRLSFIARRAKEIQKRQGGKLATARRQAELEAT